MKMILLRIMAMVVGIIKGNLGSTLQILQLRQEILVKIIKVI